MFQSVTGTELLSRVILRTVFHFLTFSHFLKKEKKKEREKERKLHMHFPIDDERSVF